MTTPPPNRRRLIGPPEFSMEPYRAKLRHSAMRLNSPGASAWRRSVCKSSPILFGLYYMRDHMKLIAEDGTTVNALSQFHVELAMSAKRWMRTDIGPQEIRDAWIAPRESAKALALDTPILTANRGWSTHGELEVGDQVFDENGTPCRVTWTSPRWLDRPCYQITFADGEQIVADADHEWFVHDRNRERSLLRTTEQMADDWLLNRARPEARYSVKNCGPLQYPEALLPISPYVLGVWLGDGDSRGGRITVGHDDAEQLVAQLASEGESPNLTRPPSATALSVQLSKPRPRLCPREHALAPPRLRAPGRYAPCKRCVADHQRRGYGGPELRAATNTPLIARLRDANLLRNKHIPEVYFTASSDQRLALLQGLMDTDGTIGRDRPSCSFTGTNERLCRGVLRLAQSLGIKARISEGRAKISGVDKGPVWRVTFRTDLPVFRLGRKLARMKPTVSAGKRHIVGVERVENQVTSCISVDSPSHLYLAGRALIPTHNSTWLFLILTLWALAYGHRKFIVVYSDIEGIAQQHLMTFLLELSQNDRLIRDFPELCTPMKVGGRAVMKNASGYLAANGSAIVVKGMNSATLGAKLRERRPDAIFCDDIEPKEGDYSMPRKEKRLTDLVEAIFPCNYNAVVQIVGTTVMHGSIIHDIIEGKPWVAAQNISVHHFVGIVEDPATGLERSCWPEKWSLEFLRNERTKNKRSYAKNFENRPVSPNGTYWDDDDITYTDKYLRWTTDRIMVVDPAAKSKKSNDETGIAVLAYAQNARKTTVERVVGVRLKPTQLRELVHRVAAKNGIKLILVDVTNGGDHVLNTLAPLPAGVKILPIHISKRSKADRFSELHDLYQRSEIVHAKPMPELEAQMKAYPDTLHDDQIDVVALGAQYFTKGFPGLVAVR